VFKRIENLLSEADHNQLHDTLTSFEFDWHYMPSTVPPDVKQDVSELNSFELYEAGQFIHLFYDQQPLSPYWNLVEPILNSLDKEIVEIGRIKANLLTQNNSGKSLVNCPHVDRDREGWHSLIYYVNDCDGNTVMFDKKANQGFDNLQIQDTATPQKNTAVLFQSDWYHTSTNPIDSTRRIVLNFILRFKND
jgi:hypothetical protein